MDVEILEEVDGELVPVTCARQGCIAGVKGAYGALCGEHLMEERWKWKLARDEGRLVDRAQVQAAADR